jgi:Mn-containing catalase
MSEAPDNHELARHLAVLEERMNTHQATYETALERLEGRMETALERLERKMAERDAEAAKSDARKTEREATARWWQTAIMLAGFGVLLAGIGVATSFIINYLAG